VPERHQGEDRPHALVVGAEDDADALDADERDQRPEDEGEDPKGVFRGERESVLGGREGLAKSMERTRADVALDDAQRAKGEDGQLASARSRVTAHEMNIASP
jgi:hypothetical protein